ncbi:MAG: YhbY family RNA-binding protein [Nanoarchaeota archaeon]
MTILGQMQIGKQGLTDNFIETLKKHFDKFRTVKISVLKSATRDKVEMKNMGEKIASRLGSNYTSKIIGFTIIVQRWRNRIK